MSNLVDMHARHSRVLAELAETGMAMVRRLRSAMDRADDVPVLTQLGLAYHRVSRAVRQTMALEARLAQGARREERPAASPPAAPRAEPAAPRAPVERTGWDEYESDDSCEALDELDELLEAEELDVEAVHEAIEASMASILHDLRADPKLAAALGVEFAEPVAALAKPGGPGPGGRRSGLMGATALALPMADLRRSATPGRSPRWPGSG